MARQRQQSGQGGIGRKFCPVCHRQVLSAFKGEVTAVGKSELLSTNLMEGYAIGQCECGKRVRWDREVSRPR